MYSVQLKWGGILYTMTVRRKRTPEELAAAYQAIESMRKLNLEVQCNELNIPYNQEVCTMCLLSSDPSTSKSKFSLTGMLPLPKKKSPPCLICAAPTCSAHSSASFRKDKVVVCVECETFFDTDLHDYSEDERQLQQHFERIMDIYDRVLLLLKYAAQEVIVPLAAQLEAHEVQNDSVGLGTTSAGIFSSVLGLAGMATIMTPAGAPLLMASLLTGGTSTAVSVGHEISKSFNEQQKMADRIIVLHGMLISILKATNDLRRFLLKDKLLSKFPDDTQSLKKAHNAYLETLSKSVSLSRKVNTGLKIGAKAGYTTTSAIPGASLMNTVPFLGPALSATFLAMDAKSVKETLHRIHKGSPCEKAELLRAIHNDLDVCIPPTEILDQDFAALVKAVRLRSQIKSESSRHLLLGSTAENESQ